jgi:UDP:flavonoid glycosyltransferase YjiC (YdhE family)
MRVLVVATPLVGHLLPLLTLAAALREAGNEVTVATAGAAMAACPAELGSCDVAPGLRVFPLMLQFGLRHPRLARSEAKGEGNLDAVGHLWAPVNRRMAEGVAAAAERVRPDLVLHEPFAATGAEVAARREIPSVVVENSLFDAARQLSSAVAAYGCGPLPPPTEILSTAPPSLVGARSGRPMRFVGTSPERQFPEKFARPGERPRVLVSRSTVEAPGRDKLMSTVAAAAEGLDAEVVLVRPDRGVAVRTLPANVRTTDWLPFPTVLPAAAGIVHHGGAGTVLTALAAGVPQLVLRGAGDRRTNAELLAARGAGIAADLADITAAALERLVRDQGLCDAAREVAAEMAAMPAPAELVPVLTALAAPGADRPGATAPPPETGRTT